MVKAYVAHPKKDDIGLLNEKWASRPSNKKKQNSKNSNFGRVRWLEKKDGDSNWWKG